MTKTCAGSALRKDRFISEIQKHASELDPYMPIVDALFFRCANCSHRFYCLKYGVEALGIRKEDLLKAMTKILLNCDELRKGGMSWRGNLDNLAKPVEGFRFRSDATGVRPHSINRRKGRRKVVNNEE